MSAEAKASRRRGYTRLSSKNQVTRPVDVLARARLKASDELKVEVDERGRIVLSTQDAFEDAIGSMTGLWAGFDLQALRDEWER